MTTTDYFLDVRDSAGSTCCSSSKSAVSTPKPTCRIERLKAARERYAATLEAVGCICKALLARNLETCCSSPSESLLKSGTPRSSTSSRRLRPTTPPRSPCKPSGTCCSSNKLANESGTTYTANDKKRCTKKEVEVGCCARDNASPDLVAPDSSCGTQRYDVDGKALLDRSELENCGSSCCNSTLAQKSYIVCSSTTKEIAATKSCCTSESKISGPDVLDDCCGNSSAKDDVTFPKVEPQSCSRDTEQSPLVTEHISLSVQGMTCVGCEIKLFRSLSVIPGIRNLQTSLVLSRAEFDKDADASSLSELIREIGKKTGFSCQRLSTHGQKLDLLVPGDARDFVNQKLPHGIERITATDKTTVQVSYDAKLIGARDVLQAFGPGPSLAPARPHAELESGSKHVRQTAYMTLFSAVLTIPVLVLAWAPVKPRPILYGSVSLVLATIVQSVVAGPFYLSAFKALLFTRIIEMDLLIVLSTSTAYIFSLVAFAYEVKGKPLSTGEFFETSTLLVTLIMVGRLVSALARQKAVESVSVRSLQSVTALLLDSNTDGGREVDARLLQYGDIFKVLPDSRITTDATVISGESEVDESHVTGEALPVEKSPGSNIIAGCLNGTGTLVARLTRLPGENTISEIATMVDEAKLSKPKIQELADRVASYFVPVVIVLTLITLAIWAGVGKAVQHRTGGSAVVQAITYAIAVLIVSCPCAIGLAVPMVVVIAGGVGARHGVVFKTAETIEIARNVSHVVFDKTGTLTQGKMSVSTVDYFDQLQHSSTASLVLGLIMNSKHPVSAAVAAYLLSKGVQPVSVEGVRSITGSGMEGTWNGQKIRAGNSRWLQVEDKSSVALGQSQGRTVFCVALGDILVALYGLDDSLRDDAGKVVSELQKRGIAISIVSGDDDGAVQKVGQALGVDKTQIRSRCSPGDKRNYIKALMKDTKKVILFCGDGTNDAVALAQASIGVHMNSGTDVAQSAADVVLLRPALHGVLVLIDLSKAAYRRVAFNFAWSFLYNTVAVLLAAGAFVDARIPPEYAGLGEIVSVLPVILIALQLRWFKPSV